MQDFIKSKYTLIIDNISFENKEFEISLNNNETLDRASLILINYINHHSKDFKDYKFVIIMIIFKGLSIKKWEILKN